MQFTCRFQHSEYKYNVPCLTKLSNYLKEQGTKKPSMTVEQNTFETNITKFIENYSSLCLSRGF